MMKRGERFHRRKSPRLSSASSSELIAEPRSTHKIRPDSDSSASWALSLHCPEPVPLQICLPSEEISNDLGRSPRFTAKNCREPMQERGSMKFRAFSALDSSQLRRSPRFSSPSSSSSIPALTSRNAKIGKGRTSEDNGAIIGHPSKMVRTSNSELLALAEFDSGLNKKSVITKCLRSRTLIVIVGNEERAMGGMDSDKTDCDHVLMSEKCLRSRKIKYPLIESPRSLENRVLQRNKKRSLMSNFALPEPPSARKSGSVELESPLCPENKALMSSQRRSPRLNIALPEPPSTQISDYVGDLVDSSQGSGPEALSRSQRRSPRLNPSLIELPSVRKNDCVEKCLRSRNIVMNVGKVGEEKKKAPGAFKIGSRSSQRLNRETADESLKHGILALPVQYPLINKTALCMENCLKKGVEQETGSSIESTGNVVLDVNSLRALRIKSLLDELFDDSEFMDLEKCESQVINERCLTSGKIGIKVDDHELAKENFVPIEGHHLKAQKT